MLDTLQVQIQEKRGEVTGKPYFKVVGFEMPWCPSAENAQQVYATLNWANEASYFEGSKARDNKTTRPKAGSTSSVLEIVEEVAEQTDTKTD